jgi:serine phosphatase RsbU (regulator of sigma subunit)
VKFAHLYRSATKEAAIGGDFYDVFEVKDGRVAVLVGDVCGHGLDAARTSTLVRDVVHAFAHQFKSPSLVLRKANEFLIEKKTAGFVTVHLGILDSDTGLLRYSSAGHPPVLLRRASGEIEALGSGSSPLGINPETHWKMAEIEMEADDILLLYTDGLIEARRDGELFGQKRLEQLLKRKRLSLLRLPYLILDQVLAFSGGTLRDDLAILAVSLADPMGEGQVKKRFKQEKLLG